jgi:U1 zinc finger
MQVLHRLTSAQPKYWCKHCSTYVKDTKFERSQHEATGKHQGSLKRFLRSIQNDHEKDEREKQRAKSEVERLNKAVGAPSASSIPGNAYISRSATTSGTTQITTADRKRQMAQLVEMGIAVPDEYRRDMALAGDWEVISQTPVALDQQGAGLNRGVRKRKFEDQDEEEAAGESVQKKGWGSTTKRYPAKEQPLEELLTSSILVKKASAVELKKEDSNQHPAEVRAGTDAQVDHDDVDATNQVTVKQEDEAPISSSSSLPGQVPEKTDRISPGPLEIVFKKRKAKSTRPK